MERRVVWTETAWRDLEQAADYIAEDSPNYAASLVRDARRASRSLRRFAGRGRITPEIGEPNVRELFVGSHRLIYRVADDQVAILGFIHGARDLAALWASEDRTA